MSLLKYFKVNGVKTEGSSSSLPDPSGPLSEKMPATSIKEANTHSSRQSTGGKGCAQYMMVTP